MRVFLVSEPARPLNSLPQLGHVISQLELLMPSAPLPCIEAAGHGKAWKQEVQEARAWCSWRKQTDLVPSAIRVGGWRPRGPLSHGWRQLG